LTKNGRGIGVGPYWLKIHAIEAGFEYVTERNGAKIYRKRK